MAESDDPRTSSGGGMRHDVGMGIICVDHAQGAGPQQPGDPQLGREVSADRAMIVEVVVAETGVGETGKPQTGEAVLITSVR